MTSALRVRQLARSLGKNAMGSHASNTGRTTRRASSVVVASLPKPAREILVTSSVILSSAGAAHAEDSAVVDSAVSSIVEIVKATGDAVKVGLGVAEQGVAAAKGAYQTVAPVVQTAADTVGPAVKSAVQAATPVVEAGVRAAGQAASSVRPSLERALSDTGVDTKVVSDAGESAVATAKPLLDTLVQFLTTSSPTVLAETALGLVAAYYLLPPVLKASSGLLRGYAGDVSPAAALDALATQSNAVLVDIRTAREKEQTGIPDLPNSGKLIELEYASIDDRKVRSQLRDISKLELKITGMQIAALKRLSKGSPIFILDRNGGTAKAVAREIAARGYGKVFVVTGGFSGWQRDRLGTKLSQSVSRVEVLLPGSIRTGSSSTRQGSAKNSQVLPPQTARRALPAGR